MGKKSKQRKPQSPKNLLTKGINKMTRGQKRNGKPSSMFSQLYHLDL